MGKKISACSLLMHYIERANLEDLILGDVNISISMPEERPTLRTVPMQPFTTEIDDSTFAI